MKIENIIWSMNENKSKSDDDKSNYWDSNTFSQERKLIYASKFHIGNHSMIEYYLRCCFWYITVPLTCSCTDIFRWRVFFPFTSRIERLYFDTVSYWWGETSVCRVEELPSPSSLLMYWVDKSSRIVSSSMTSGTVWWNFKSADLHWSTR